MSSYLSHPSSDHGGEVLVLLWLSTSSTSSVVFYPSTWWLCQPSIGAQPDPIDHLLNPPHEQITPAVGHLIHQGIHGLVPSLPSAHAAHFPKRQMPLRIAPWQGDGNRRSEQDKEVFLDLGIGRAADGRGSSVCSSQALASNWGPGSHGSNQFGPNRPKPGCSVQRAEPQTLSFLFRTQGFQSCSGLSERTSS